MNKKELSVFAKQPPEYIKSEANLNYFKVMLTKVTVEAELGHYFVASPSYSH